jgi:hypothetical protein
MALEPAQGLVLELEQEHRLEAVLAAAKAMAQGRWLEQWSEASTGQAMGQKETCRV